MGVQPPHLYEDVRSTRSFDPRAVSRLSQQPKPQRPKQEGPLVSFNAHPDSYIQPFGQSNATPMKASTKKWIKALRVVQLIFRIMALICALGLLTFLIMIRGMDTAIFWLTRVASALAIAHTAYGVYHLALKVTHRTPASSASYMLFAAFLDTTIIACYTLGSVVSATRQSGWTTILANQDLIRTFSLVIFYSFTVGAGLHLVCLALAINLAITFRRITQLPPDMNPLEDNLTSRHSVHKRNKSSISTFSVATTKRNSTLEEKRASGSAYEDLTPPPTVPFFHTRTQSTDSFTTYNSAGPPSRDSLPSRQYGVQPSNVSQRSSMVEMKRNSYQSPQKQRGSYAELPLADTANYQVHGSDDNDKASSFRSMPRKQEPTSQGGWYANDSLTSRSSQKKPYTPDYESIAQPYDDLTCRTPTLPVLDQGYNFLDRPYDSASSDISTNHSRSRSRSNSQNRSRPTSVHSSRPISQHVSRPISQHNSHPNPVGANPPTSNRHTNFPRGSAVTTNSPLSEISTNKRESSSVYSRDSNDIADHHQHLFPDHASHQPQASSPVIREKTSFKARGYGDLKPGAPPVMVGGDLGRRQVSSGVDYGMSVGKAGKRDVSGKIVEEGRGAGASAWGTRLRKVSGILM